jgi:hypothetical protein
MLVYMTAGWHSGPGCCVLTLPIMPCYGQAVSQFLRGRLVGEGNVVRHLEMLGFKLHYKQSALLEYPFAVHNLAADLRDGLRLTRLIELLSGESPWRLTSRRSLV